MVNRCIRTERERERNGQENEKPNDAGNGGRMEKIGSSGWGQT